MKTTAQSFNSASSQSWYVFQFALIKGGMEVGLLGLFFLISRRMGTFVNTFYYSRGLLGILDFGLSTH